MKTIYPFFLVKFDEEHKQQVTLDGTDITIKLITMYNQNKRESAPELATIIASHNEAEYPQGMQVYVHYLARADWNLLFIPETQETFYKIPLSTLLFEVKNNELLPLPGFCLGKQVVNPDRFSPYAPMEIRMEPLKDVAELVAVHPDLDEVKVGDIIKTNKFGTGYTIFLNKCIYYKIAMIDIECVVNDYRQIK